MLRKLDASALGAVLAAVAIAGVGAGSATPRAQVAKDDAAVSGSTLAKAPFYFEANEGQVDERVQYFARGSEGSLFLTSREAVFDLRASGKPNGGVVRMGLHGARQAKARGAEPAGVGVRYFHGKDPSKWNPDVATFKKVEYAQVYPGIDLVYYGTDGALEYDFQVAPGADPENIALSFSGQQGMEIGADGALTIHAGERDLRQEPPVAYQEHDGQRRKVDARFALDGENQVRFALADYDPSLPLVIDPKLVFSTFLGGNGMEKGTGIALDSAGDVYVTGTTFSGTFPVTDDAAQPEAFGGSEAYVAKYAADGALIYSSFLGGSSFETSGGIAVGADGQIYLTGATFSDDFPVTADSAQPDTELSWDAYVARLDPSGFVTYATFLGGTFEDRGYSIAVDAAGIIYVGGRTASNNFPAAAPARNGFQTYQNYEDGFLVKLDPNEIGSDQILYATYVGGQRYDEVNEILVRGTRVYLVGTTTSANFPTTPGVFRPSKAGLPDVADAFVGVFDLAQSGAASRLWLSYFGGTGADTGEGLAVNGLGNIYFAGGTASTNLPKKTAAGMGLNYTFGGGDTDAYFALINPTGTSLLRASYIGGKGNEEALDIEVDSSNSIFITGVSNSNPFPIKYPVSGPRGWGDAFLVKLDQSNYTLVYSTLVGGTGMDVATSVAVDSTGVNAFITGGTASVATFPIVNAAQPYFGGEAIGGKKLDDAFVARIGPKKDPRVLAKANGVEGTLVKECTGPLTPVTLDGSASQGFNTRITLHRWSLNGLIVGIVPKVTISKPVGTYVYTLTVTDSVGDSGSKTVEVQIVDTTAPSFTAVGNVRPANITVKAPPGQSSAIVNVGGPAKAVDKCDGVITAVGTRSDSLALTAPFPIGVRTVSWVATDGSGNSATYTQTITVNP